MARPTKYSEEIATIICSCLAEGESLRSICKNEDLPSRETVRNWLKTNEAFLGQYVRAREEQADNFAEEILEIADDATNDFMERKRQDGSTEEVFDKEHVQRSKLRVDARKWLMSKMAPTKYGEKLELGGPDGQAIVPVLNVTIGSDKS